MLAVPAAVLLCPINTFASLDPIPSPAETDPLDESEVADNDPIVVSTPQGLFRLAGNETNYSVDDVAIYGMTFAAVEVII